MCDFGLTLLNYLKQRRAILKNLESPNSKIPKGSLKNNFFKKPLIMQEIKF